LVPGLPPESPESPVDPGGDDSGPEVVEDDCCFIEGVEPPDEPDFEVIDGGPDVPNPDTSLPDTTQRGEDQKPGQDGIGPSPDSKGDVLPDDDTGGGGGGGGGDGCSIHGGLTSGSADGGTGAHVIPAVLLLLLGCLLLLFSKSARHRRSC